MSVRSDDRERQSIVQDLASSDEEIRRLAVERVSTLPLAEALPLLVDRLGDESWRVRKSTVERLVSSSDAEGVVEALVAALADGENPGRRNSAVEALVECGPRGVPRLLEAARGDDADVRKLVLDALSGIADPRSSEVLLQRLEDPDVNVRAAAADALGGLGDPGFAEALLHTAVRDGEDPLVRFSALHALGVLEAPLRARDLTSVLDEKLLRSAALGLLGRRADDAEGIDVLLKGLGSDVRSSREAAMRSLLRLLSRLDGPQAERLVERIRDAVEPGGETVRSALDRLGDAVLSSRLVIVQFLGLRGREETAVPILEAAGDEALAEVCLSTLEAMGEAAERQVAEAWPQLPLAARRDACSLFGRSGGECSAVRLLAALEDTDPEIRIAAARAIARRRLAGALAPLAHRLDCVASDEEPENDEELQTLADALIEVGGEAANVARAVELLEARLTGAVEEVRVAVARVLGCIGRHEDTPLVTLLMKDPSARVRRAAVDALARVEPGTAAEPLRLALADESAPVRIAAAVALGASERDEVLDDLHSLAEDEDPRVRAAAVQALGRRFGPSLDAKRRAQALAALEAALTDDALVALAAVTALDSIGGEESGRVSALLERAEPELVKEAVTCLGRHGAADQLEMLIPLVGHADWSVRAEAIQALAGRGVHRAVPAILRRLETELDAFVRDSILRALKRLGD
jgi:HEAT repeat protein